MAILGAVVVNFEVDGSDGKCDRNAITVGLYGYLYIVLWLLAMACNIWNLSLTHL